MNNIEFKIGVLYIIAEASYITKGNRDILQDANILQLTKNIFKLPEQMANKQMFNNIKKRGYEEN